MEGERSPEARTLQKPWGESRPGYIPGTTGRGCTWSLSAWGHEVVRARTGKWSDEMGL